jgi:ubiquinone/menaquinone biosynthesis C-methylase UbiE
MDKIINHYSNYDEEVRLEYRHGRVEFLTTMRYIEKYLPQIPDAYILEVGAGTGRYSRTIADMGYTVEAVELVPHNIEVFLSKITPAQNITVTQGNALDLNMFADDTFDMTLVLGPLYHLFTETDKQQAIREALRVTKPGGFIFAAYVISDAPVLEDGFVRNLWDISEQIAKGKIDPVTFATTSTPADIFSLVRKEDIDKLMIPFRTERLHYVATNLISRFLRENLANMDEKTFNLYMNYHYAVCERTDMVGLTHHSLDIFRKPGF